MKEVVKYAPKGEALDIGAGEGRNSLFLAEQGFKVTAIDIIPEGLIKLKELAKKLHLKVTTKVKDVRKFEFLPEKYSLIISIAAIDFLKKSEIEKLVKKIKKSLIRKGIVYFSVFSIKDPFFKKLKKFQFSEIEPNTFYLPKPNLYRHFFTTKEISGYFKDFQTIFLKERKIKDTSHDKPHFHWIIDFVGRKIK